MKLLLATRNRNKVTELLSMLEGTGWQVVTLADLEDMPDVEEDGATFEESARKKARSAARRTKMVKASAAASSPSASSFSSSRTSEVRVHDLQPLRDGRRGRRHELRESHRSRAGDNSRIEVALLPNHPVDNVIGKPRIPGQRFDDFRVPPRVVHLQLGQGEAALSRNVSREIHRAA